MKSTWKKSDGSRRWKLALGFVLFVVGVALAAYCGYVERYVGDASSESLKISGWCLLFAGLILFTFGILQGRIRR